MKWWLARFDSLIEKNLHHKGIVHCVSYKRMRFIYDNSQYREFMLVHNSHDRQSVIEAFRRREAPAILLSPSVDTGYDFKDSEARFQVVAKLPFASTQDRVIKARQELDKEYGMYLTAQTLVQMAGRIVRSESDFGATYILDGNWEWFQNRARRYFPKWFMEAVVWADGVPEPINEEQFNVQSYQVTTGYYCCGVDVQGGKVIAAAPIMKWSIGKEWGKVAEWVAKKNGKVEAIHAGDLQ
jgi:Rad3-related DNA helicase